MRNLFLTIVVVVASAGLIAGATTGDGTKTAFGGSKTAMGSDMFPGGIVGIPPAYVDYNVADVSGTNGVKEATWANSGSAGAEWDMLSNVGGGLIYRSAGNCIYGDGPCMVADGSSVLRDTSANVTTWGATVMCAVFYKEDVSVTTDYVHWTNNFVSHGLLKEFSTLAARLVNGGSDYFDDSDETGLNAFCWDMSDVTAVMITSNGSAPLGPTDFTAGTFRLPTHMAVGGNYTGTNFCTNCEFHRVLVYNENPGLGIQELSRRLYEQYSVPDDPCLSDAAVDYDARALAVGTLSDWPNNGDEGASWDIGQITAADYPTVQPSTSCNGASRQCVEFVDSSDHLEVSGASATWTERFFCTLYYEDATGDNYLYTWIPGDSDNRVASGAGIDYLVRGTSTTLGHGTISAGWHTLCLDATTESSATLYVDGTSVASSIDMGTVADPTGWVLGNLSGASSLGAPGVKIGRFLAWNGSHCTASEINTALRTQWGL